MTTLTQPPPRPRRDRPHGGSVLTAGHRGTWCAGTGPQPSGPGDGRPPGHPPQPPPPNPGNPDAPPRAGQTPPYPPGGPGPGPGPTGPGPGPSGPSGPGRWIRAVSTVGAWAITVPLAAWGLMLLSGAVAPDEGRSYLGTLAAVTVGVLAFEGIASEWRYIRDGAR